jgi:PAS domain S-box-containing protein
MLYLNRSAENLYGWNLTNLAGRVGAPPIYKVPSQFHAAKKTALARGEWSGDLSQVTRDGRDLIIGSRWTLLHDHEGRPKSILFINTDIAERKRAESALAGMNRQLRDVSRQAGMAEVATSVLHSVGNVLNSVNVASSCLAVSLRKSKATNLSKVVDLLRAHKEDLGSFLTSDPKGRELPGYLGQLAEHLAGEQTDALTELAQLQKNIEHIKDIVSMQQNFAKVSGLVETIPAAELVEEALCIGFSSFTHQAIVVTREFLKVPPITVEKHKVLQILVDLVRNAGQACEEGNPPEKRLRVRISDGGDRVRIAVTDNGTGIRSENLTRIFAHGFTTKKTGHGFGLHSGALMAREMGGSLTGQSDGPGLGATFILELPSSPGEISGG